jgi:hypothetical protein
MDSLSVYRDLADRYDRLGQASMRDRFLILAADAALASGQADEAERLRQRLLTGNRHHMLKPYGSFAEAVRAADVETYLRDLRANYPPEVAGQLLNSLGGPGADDTLPVPGLSGAGIPATAPVLDLTEPGVLPPVPLADAPRREERSARPRGNPTPYAPPVVALEQPLPSTLPTGAPLRGNAGPLPVANPPRPAPLARAAPYPVAPPVPLPARVAPAAPARVAPPRQSPPPSRGGAWLNMVLVGVVVTAGLALAAFTLARPFLPAGWAP